MKRKLLWSAIIVIVLAGLGGWWLRRPVPKAAVPSAPKAVYVAMGDSVAAGVGLKTDSDSSACDRTKEAYPYAVAGSMDLRLINIACSSARLTAGVVGPQTVNKLELAPQLDRLFAGPKPDYISLTAGANDAEWIALIGKCYSAACGTAADTASVQAKLATVQQNLRAALTALEGHYASAVPVVAVTGYHQVFPEAPAAGCNETGGLEASELTWARAQQTALNTAIESTVKEFPFAHFAAVDFTRHELCSSDSWVQGVGSRQPYHPTEAGQAEYAKQVLAIFKARK